MKLALALAAKSHPSPNPQVGAVVVADGEVIGSGYHDHPGAPHAEIVALADAGNRTRGTDLYVTLEPCVHHGRTGPCVEAILEAGISRVIVGISDPDPRVNGAGIRFLEQHGLTVVSGVLEEACRAQLKSYITHRQLRRPYTTLKAAITLDGYLASVTGDARWISSKASRTVAHEMRASSDAVLVGIGTVLADEPMLTVRHVPGNSPQRVILDSRLRTPLTARIVTSAREIPTIIVHTAGEDRAAPFCDIPGIEMLQCTATGNGRVDLVDLSQKLGDRGITSLLVEGGATVITAFMEASIADELVLFIAPRILGQGRSFINHPKATTIKEGLLLKNPVISRAGPDIIYRVTLTDPD